MSNVQFEDPNVGISELTGRPKVYRGLIGFLINRGFAKSEFQANLILGGIILLSFIFIIFYWIGGSDNGKVIPTADIIHKTQFLPR